MMAVTSTKTIDVNAYVEAAPKYGADKVKVDLDTATFVVRAYPVDVYGAQVADTSDILKKTLANLTLATAYYAEIIHQLEQGDVIRNI